MSANAPSAGGGKMLLVGVLFLFCALLLGWWGARGGKVGFWESDQGDGGPVLRETKRHRDELPEVASVTESYFRKVERGMEVKEVRWILEDFMALGLGLTLEQRREAEESMRMLRERDFTEFMKFLDGIQVIEAGGRVMKIFDGGRARKLMDANSWLVPAYLPSSLCELRAD